MVCGRECNQQKECSMLYNIVMYVMQMVVAFWSLFNEKMRKMWQGERASFEVLRQKVDPRAKYVWFHAASLGEFEQGRPLIEAIRAQYPDYKILLTFFSPSGYEVRKNYEGADIVTYLPIDTFGNARRFLRTIRPVMAFFIKYEFWYNYLHILRHRNVPVYSVSSIFRPDQVFFKWYGKGYGRVLRCFTHYFVQNEESKRLLATIGINAVDVVGDTRFDRVLQVRKAAKVLPKVEAFVVGKSENAERRPVFVAGSSWQPDEEIFLRYFSAYHDWKIIIAPHVIDAVHLEQIVHLAGNKKVVRYSEVTPNEAAQADVLIIDCFGLLSSVYHYGNIAYVGGGFGAGIHNVLEAAVWGIPVIFGPNNKNFDEAQGLLKVGGGFEIKNFEDFSDLMKRLQSNNALLTTSASAAEKFVENLAGATDKILSKVRL